MVDFLWAGRRLILETDSAFVHGTATAQRDDARRDQALRRMGFRVLRFTYADVVTRGDHVARRLRDELTG